MRSGETIIRGNVATPSGIIQNGAVVVSDGVIIDVDSTAIHARNSHDGAADVWVLPGMIDTHSDAIETEIQPRPNSPFSIDISFHELERKLAMQGVTTIYHSLSMYADDSKDWKRQNETVRAWIHDIRRLSCQRHLIRHRIHLRFEITNLNAVPHVEELISSRNIDQISFMDHSPGQGQFRSLEVQKRFIMSTNDVSDEEATRLLEQRRNQPRVDADKLSEIARLAHEHSIPLASHDDDTVEKFAIMDEWHVAISEFPVELDAALEAKRRGLYVVMGAPNVLLGRSHSNNLSALAAIDQGVVDILCSDYYPPALLQAVFALFRRGLPLHEVVTMVSLNPARALGLADRTGSLDIGKDADLVVVGHEKSIPVISEVYVGGSRVCQTSYHHLRMAATY